MIICILIIIIIGIVGFILYNNISNTLNEDEKKVASTILDYKSNLKRPDSMQVYGIIFKKEEDGSATVVFDYSAQNGFGGINRNRAMYLIKADGTYTYWGNDSEADRTITKYTSTEDILEINFAKVVKKYWEERKDFVTLDVDKIMRNLDQAE